MPWDNELQVLELAVRRNMADNKQPEIDLKQAVQIALEKVQELYEIQGVELNELLLEEVRGTPTEWYVTVGFTRPAGSVAGLIGAGSRRVYKQTRIDKETGEFLGMQIRDPQS